MIRICDPAEGELPNLGLMNLQDPETGQVALINTRSKALREKWRNYHKQNTSRLTELFKKAGVDMEEVYTHRSAVEPLTRLFDRRRQRIK